MRPILFHLQFGAWSLSLPAYGTAMVLMLLLIVLGAWALAVRRGLRAWPALAFSATVALALPVGSRILYWMMNPGLRQAEPYLLIRVGFSGFYLPGGLALAVALGALLCRPLELDFWRMADSTAPAMGLGGAVLRIGCFLNGCCFGLPTSLPWGVRFPAGSPAHLAQAAHRLDVLFSGPLPVHPTQLYELAASLVAAAIALAILRRRAPDGVAALAAGAWFVLFRWGNSFLRASDQSAGWPADVTAMCHAGVLLVCLALLVWRMRRANPSPCGAAPPASPSRT